METKKTATTTNSAQRLLAAVCAILVAVGMLVGLSACGQTQTLQDVVTQSDLQQLADSASADGFQVLVSVRDNNLALTYTIDTGDALSDTAVCAYLGFTDWDSLYSSVDAQASTDISNLEDEYGLTGVTLTIAFKDADGSTISEHTFS